MIKQETDKKFRFIPYRKHDIVEMCLQDNLLPGQEEIFRKLYRILDSTFHFEFHQTLESLKDSYAPFDPDSDTRRYENAAVTSGAKFIDLLRDLLEKANYECITKEDIDQAMKEYSLFKIRLHVDFNEFDELMLFSRGESIKYETIPRFLGLFPKTIKFINYDRMVMYIRFREERRKSKVQYPSLKYGFTLLKLFQNVPKSDLEMLFPNTNIRMRTIDKLMIGIPAAVSGFIVLTTKVGVSLVLLASLIRFWLGFSNQSVEINKTVILVLFAGLAAFGGYIWKQISTFKNRKLMFMQALTQNLYFKNLDNNSGVFHRIIDDAEEEECKEAILAYYFLLTSEAPLQKKEIDLKVENWLETKWNCSVDFEIDDALNKLARLNLVNEVNGKFTAISIQNGISILDRRWDDFFTVD